MRTTYVLYINECTADPSGAMYQNDGWIYHVKPYHRYVARVTPTVEDATVVYEKHLTPIAHCATWLNTFVQRVVIDNVLTSCFRYIAGKLSRDMQCYAIQRDARCIALCHDLDDEMWSDACHIYGDPSLTFTVMRRRVMHMTLDGVLREYEMPTSYASWLTHAEMTPAQWLVVARYVPEWPLHQHVNYVFDGQAGFTTKPLPLALPVYVEDGVDVGIEDTVKDTADAKVESPASTASKRSRLDELRDADPLAKRVRVN